MSGASPLVSLIGPTVQGKAGPVDVSSISAKVIGLYFSAHWCPPCRGFTPVLAKFYSDLKASKPGEFECVFVSSDRDEGAFAEYFDSMPWLALPFSDRARKGALSSRFKVQGIPTLVLLDGAGNVITTKASNYLRADPTGAAFPFAEKSPKEVLLAGKYKQGAGASDVPAAEVLSHEYTIVLINVPDRSPFTEAFVKWFNDNKSKHDVGAVYVSVAAGRGSGSGFGAVAATLPFPYLDPADDGTARQLVDAFDMETVPRLVLLRKDGSVARADATAYFKVDADGFPWAPKPCEPLGIAIQDINDVKTAVLMLDKLTDDAAAVAVTEAFNTVALEFWDGGKADGDDTIRFAVGAGEEANVDGLRNFLGFLRDKDGPTSVRLVVVNVQGGGFYAWPGAGIPSEDDIRTFIGSVKAGTATQTAFRR